MLNLEASKYSVEDLQRCCLQLQVENVSYIIWTDPQLGKSLIYLEEFLLRKSKENQKKIPILRLPS
jgi:hypothetical protein